MDENHKKTLLETFERKVCPKCGNDRVITEKDIAFTIKSFTCCTRCGWNPSVAGLTYYTEAGSLPKSITQSIMHSENEKTI